MLCGRTDPEAMAQHRRILDEQLQRTELALYPWRFFTVDQICAWIRQLQENTGLAS